jgi:GNAT superfamily N-acetyltransferase
MIRPPRPGDGDGIAALLGQLGYPASSAAVQARLADCVDRGRVAVFVAETGHTPVGLATAYAVPVIHADRPVAVLSALVVHEAHRRKGVGRQLLEAVEAWAREQRAYRITLSSGLAREDAHAFYERLGYEHTARRYSRLL